MLEITSLKCGKDFDINSECSGGYSFFQNAVSWHTSETFAGDWFLGPIFADCWLYLNFWSWRLVSGAASDFSWILRGGLECGTWPVLFGSSNMTLSTVCWATCPSIRAFKVSSHRHACTRTSLQQCKPWKVCVYVLGGKEVTGRWLQQELRAALIHNFAFSGLRNTSLSNLSSHT